MTVFVVKVTGETITDAQIKELRDSPSPVTGNIGYACSIALGEQRGTRMGSSKSEERDARTRCADAWNARHDGAT